MADIADSGGAMKETINTLPGAGELRRVPSFIAARAGFPNCMNTIENKIAIGSPHSLARYQNAHRICADCLDKAPQVFGETQKPCGEWIPRAGTIYKAIPIGNGFASYDGTCYVCEQKAHVAVVEFIPARDVDRDGAMSMCAELGID